MTTAIIIAAVAVIAIILMVVVFKAFWKVPKADEALVVTGWGVGRGSTDTAYKVITGSGALVLPGFQRAQFLSLSTNQTTLDVQGVDSNKIPVGARGSVVFKVGNDERAITNAAIRFLDDQDEGRGGNVSKMVDLVTNVIHGHLRSIIGGMTVEDLIANRSRLAQEAREASIDEMSAMGLMIDSLQIQDLNDPSGYIQALGQPRDAEIKMASRIAQAARDREATEREQEAEALKAEARRNTAIKMAEFQASEDQARSRAEQAGPLAEAQARADVVEQETKIAELEAAREQRRLEATVNKQADAEAYRTRTEAEGEAAAQIARAEAQAREREVIGTAEAGALRARMLAEAEGIKSRGEALQVESEAVIAQQVAERLPDIVRAAAEPFGKIDNLTVFNGAAGMTDMLTQILAQAGPMLDIARHGLTNGGSGNGHHNGSEPTMTTTDEVNTQGR